MCSAGGAAGGIDGIDEELELINSKANQIAKQTDPRVLGGSRGDGSIVAHTPHTPARALTPSMSRVASAVAQAIVPDAAHAAMEPTSPQQPTSVAEVRGRQRLKAPGGHSKRFVARTQFWRF